MKEDEDLLHSGCASDCSHCAGCSTDEDFEPTITLVDEDGKETEFEILDVVVLPNEKQYLVVTEANSEDEEPEAVILEIKYEGEEEVYDTVTDEAVADEVFNAYISQFEDTDGED